MNITHELNDTLTKYVYIRIGVNRAWPDITIMKEANTSDNRLNWSPAIVRIQPNDLSQPNTYAMIGALHAALAEAVKLDALYPVGSEAKK